MPKLSVALKTYNRPEFIEGAVETALNQTYDDIEVVVVDDSSNDETRNVLQQYDGDDRVTVFHTGEKQGMSAARNQGIAASNGEYICILDDDDRWHPEKVEKQVQVMDWLDDDYAVVYTWGEIQRGTDGEVFKQYQNTRHGDICSETLGSYKMMPFSSHMIKKSALDDISRFDPAFRLASDDWDLAIRLARKYRFDCIPEPLVTSIIHGGNATEGPENAIGDEMILEKYREEVSQHPEVEKVLLGLAYQNMATAAFQRGDPFGAFRYSWSALRHESTSWRAQLALVSCFGTRGLYTARRLRQAIVS